MALIEKKCLPHNHHFYFNIYLYYVFYVFNVIVDNILKFITYF